MTDIPTVRRRIWLVSREYAGIAEAGGIKNVVTALAEGLQKAGLDVTVFIPFYGCTLLKNIADFTLVPHISAEITAENRIYALSYACAYYKGVRIIFILHSLFTSKMAVYTYTEEEQRLFGSPQGQGHSDFRLLNVLFQKSVLEYGIQSAAIPDIIHCHDAAAALVPFIARRDASYSDSYKKVRFILTVHNAGNAYRHEMGSVQGAASLLALPERFFEQSTVSGRCEPYLLAEPHAILTTVSPWYAKDLTNNASEESGGLSAVFALRGTRIRGITNGIAYDKYDPADTLISALPYAFNPAAADFDGKYACRSDFILRYSSFQTDLRSELKQYGTLCVMAADPRRIVFFSYHGRIVHQKGTDILAAAAKIVLENCDDVRFIVTGQGSTDLENQQATLAREFPGKYLYLRGYERSAARLCVAISDFIVLPSIFEPCGLEDFIAQLYGTIPIAHACGGLQKIVDGKTGFLYTDNSPQTLADIILELTRCMQKNPDFFKSLAAYASQYVQTTYSWDKIIHDEYLPLYC